MDDGPIPIQLIKPQKSFGKEIEISKVFRC